jgi:hypothetical protein
MALYLIKDRDNLLTPKDHFSTHTEQPTNLSFWFRNAEVNKSLLWIIIIIFFLIPLPSLIIILTLVTRYGYFVKLSFPSPSNTNGLPVHNTDFMDCMFRLTSAFSSGIVNTISRTLKEPGKDAK